MTRAERLRDRAACPICGGKDFAIGHLQETHEYAAIRFKAKTDGTFRRERRATLQLWTAEDDRDHRLSGERLLDILEMGSRHFDADELEIQVEFQGARTIEVFGLEADAEGALRLVGTQTACLAEEACGIPLPMATVAGACAPGSGCC